MPSTVIRRLAWLSGAGLLVAVAVIALLPFLASTQIVRDRIALELSVWSGYRVEFGSAPRIDVWPSVRATMADIRFMEWNDDSPAVIEAERIEADLSIWEALRGDIQFSTLRMIRPSARITRDGFSLSLPPSDGRFAQAVAYARSLVAANPDNPDISALPSDALGTLEIVDGKIFIGQANADQEVLSGIEARLVWPSFASSGNATLTGIWRGEVIRAEVSSAHPLLLLAGGTAGLSTTLRSAPLAFGFDGRANLSQNSAVEGELRLDAPSLRRMLEWMRSDVSGSASTGALALHGTARGDLANLKLENATMTVDGNQGRGSVDLALDASPPAISGTLAFETMDLASLLASFSSVTPESWIRRAPIDSPLMGRVSVDLRMSANRANIGTVVFTEVAASAQVRDRLASFDISDAAAFAGRLQAAIRIDGEDSGNKVELRFRGDNIDMGAFASTVQASYLMPIARANLSAAITGRGATWPDVLNTAHGSFAANFGPGAMTGPDLQRFMERAAEGEFFPLQSLGSGTLNFQKMSVRARISDGVASLEQFDLLSGGYAMALDGLLPLPGRGLALQGQIASAGQGQADGRATHFFVGGSWDAPFISPFGAP